MPRFLGLGRFFGSTVSNAGGFAAGSAVARTLTPGLQDVANAAWREHQSMPLDAFVLAEGVAQGQVTYKFAQNEALNTGISKARFDALVSIANVGPGVGEAYRMWRRGAINEAGFRRAVQRAGLEAEWIDALVKLRLETLTPGELAAAIHRGLVKDPGLLRGKQPSAEGEVPAFPEYPIDPLTEAAAHGYDRDHLGVLVGLQGLPASVTQAAEAWFRGLATWDDVLRAGAEGNTRNEWVPLIANMARQIPTARDFIENWLRGYIERDEAVAGAALHGMTPEHAELIFENSGRAMNEHQITQALAWGAKYNPSGKDDRDPYRQSTLLGPLRPEYYEMNEALKYTLPSALYFRTLQQNGVLTKEQAETWYLRLGWPPELADQVAAAFAKSRTSAAKEATATDLLTLWDGGQASEAETLAELEELGYPADEARAKMNVLAARRVAGAKSTGISDVHALFKKGALNPGHPGQTTPLTPAEEAADRTAAKTEAANRIEALGVPAATATAIVTFWDVANNGTT